MNIKKLMTMAVIAITTTTTTTTMAKGIYFVSGGDFRVPALEYTVETTANNQTTNVSPAKATPNDAKWSIKIDGVEYDGVNNADSYMTHTFAAAGTHKVKVYNNSGRSMTFNFNVTSSSATDNKRVSHIRNITVKGNNVMMMSGNPQLTNLVFRNVSGTGNNTAPFCSSANETATIRFEGTTPMTIGDTAFTFFYGVKEVVIPSNCTYINFKGFMGCSKLNKITLPNTNMDINTNLVPTATNLGGTFRGCPIKEVWFPGTIAEWNANAKYVYVFGRVEDGTIPDANGGYTLSTSDYATAIHQTLEASTLPNKTDVFWNSSSTGAMKLYLISE